MSGARRSNKALYIVAAAFIAVGFLVPLWHGVLIGALILVYLEQPILALIAALLLDLLSGSSYGLFGFPLFMTALIAVTWGIRKLLQRYLRSGSAPL